MVNTASALVATAATVGALLIASTWFFRHSSRQKPAIVLETDASTVNHRYENGNGVHTNGNEIHENVNAIHANGNGAHANGDEVHDKGSGVPVAVADEGPVSQEAKDLAALYGKMAEEFATGDLNPKAIEPLHSWFHGVEDEEETPWPKKYVELDPPLQFGAVRLLVIPLDDSPAVLRIAASVTSDIMRLLPQGTKVFANARGNYHCTVFHTSQPTDPRPDPIKPDGGTDLTLQPHRRRLPTDAEWEVELETVRKIVAATPRPTLRLERIVQASTGVLLLTWTEVGQGGIVSDLRRRLREAFPGASTKQATIIHSSLLRVVSSTPLGPTAVSDISAACRRWTERLRGTTYRPQTLWFIRETEFSTIVGDREVLTLGDASALPRHW